MREDRIVHRSLVEQVIRKVQKMIAKGKYKVGDRLPTETEMATQFGVGRSSIREAVKILNYLGVLESQVARGTFICDKSSISKEALTWSILLGKNDLNDLIEIRTAIEALSIIKLTSRYHEDPDCCREVLRRLTEQVRVMGAQYASKTNPALVEAIYDFHALVIGSSENPLFKSIFRSLRSFMVAEIRKSNRGAESGQHIVKLHQDMVDAISSGDIYRALATTLIHVDAMREHIGLVRARLLSADDSDS